METTIKKICSNELPEIEIINIASDRQT